jgi:hypothetical protein
MMRADKQEAAEIDAVLDARDAERDAATVTVTEADEPSEADRPWWESDPRITDRFKQA